MRTLTASVVAAVLSVVASSANAQLYKWVDETGAVNYGDWPPPGVKYQPITHGTVSSVSASQALAGAKQARETTREQPRSGRGTETQVNVVVAAPTGSSDDPEYVSAYAPYYGYPARRAAAREAIDRPRVEQPIVKPVLPINPAIPEMPGRSRR